MRLVCCVVLLLAVTVPLGSTAGAVTSGDLATGVPGATAALPALPPADRSACSTVLRFPSGNLKFLECEYDPNPVDRTRPADNLGGNKGPDPGLPNWRHHLLVWLPDKPPGEVATMPVIFGIHGGGFTSGNAYQFDVTTANVLNTMGFVFVANNYTLRNVCDIRLPDYATACDRIDLRADDGDTFLDDTHSIQDTANALRWTRQNLTAQWTHQVAGETVVDPPLGDPTRITLLGTSAGGVIASLLSTDPSWLTRAFGTPVSPHAVIAGLIDFSGPVSLNLTQRWPWPFEPVDLSIPWDPANTGYTIPPEMGGDGTTLLGSFQWLANSVVDLNSRGGPLDLLQTWQLLSATSTLTVARPADVPPALMLAGGGDCKAPLQPPVGEMCRYFGTDIPDPVGTVQGMRDFVKLAQAKGIHATFVQPLMAGTDTQGGFCLAFGGHSTAGAAMLYPVPIGADMMYAEQAEGACDAIAAIPDTDPRAYAVNTALGPTVLQFLRTARAGVSAPIAWAPSNMPAFSSLSIPDLQPSPLRLNLGGGTIAPNWSSARSVLSDRPKPDAYPFLGPVEARVTQGGTRATVPAPFTLPPGIGTDVPQALFQEQIVGGALPDGTTGLTLTAPVPNRRYRLRLYFGDITNSSGGRVMDVYAQGSPKPLARAVRTSGVPLQANVVDAGQVTVANRTLNLRIVQAAGASLPPMVAGVELVPVT